MPSFRALALSVLLSAAPSAFAGTYSVDSAPLTNKSEAETLVSASSEARVVRVYVDGKGYRWVARFEGIKTESSAREVGAKLASQGVGATVFERSGRQAEQVAVVHPGETKPASQPVVQVIPETVIPRAAVATDAAEASDWLKRVVGAHGVQAGTRQKVNEGDLLLRYRRTLSDGTAVDHVWAQREGGTYLEIIPHKGSAVASKTLVIGDKAWLSVNDGPFLEQNIEKTRMILSQMRPDAVLPLVLRIGDAVAEGRREFERMVVDGEGSVGELSTTALAFEGDRSAGTLTIDVGSKDHLIRQVVFEDGSIRHQYGDYRRIGALVLPHAVKTEREGGDSDVVQIQELRLGAKPDAKWFRQPS